MVGCWMNWNLRFDIAISSIIIILNIAAILYMLTHKIPLDEQVIGPLIYIGLPYLYVCLLSFTCWGLAIKHGTSSDDACIAGRISHMLGFLVLLCLLYCISHNLAIHFGLPCLIWFLPAIIVPCHPSHREDSEEQPQSAVDIV